jgi:hypothetical protein
VAFVNLPNNLMKIMYKLPNLIMRGIGIICAADNVDDVDDVAVDDVAVDDVAVDDVAVDDVAVDDVAVDEQILFRGGY